MISRPSPCPSAVEERPRSSLFYRAAILQPGRIKMVCLASFAVALVPAMANAQARTDATASPPDYESQRENDITTLSPFVVSSDSEQGYVATQTLNGTRLKSSVRDLGASMTIFTDQLMEDLAASSVLDLASFAPNTDTYVGDVSSTNGQGNEFLTSQTPQYVTRGGTTGLVSQNFFSTPSVPPDRYNAENFTFTRGPNAILFGLGNPAGAFVSSTKRANFHDKYSLEVRGDSEGSLRGVLDLNQVIVPNRLALRYAGLFENEEGFRDPTSSTQRRHFLTAQYKPFTNTAIRVNFETGKVHTVAVRPWPVWDGITPWVDAGRPTVAVARGPTNANGIQRAYGNANQSLIYTADSPAGTDIPSMSWALAGRSALPSYPNYPVVGGNAAGGFRSLVSPDLFPVDANVTGPGTFRDLDFQTEAVFIEQKLAPNFYLEAAVSHVKSDTLVASGIGGSATRLYADVNEQLPDGTPNPNVGMFYIDSFSNHLPNRLEDTTSRLMLSYDLDFARLWASHGAWLGRHRIAALLESSETDDWGGQNPSHNVTPLPGAPAAIGNLQNRVIFRYYLDPLNGVTTAGSDSSGKYPLIFAGTPLPEARAGGVTPAHVAIFGGTAAKTKLNTQMIATQSAFWNDRIVATLGFRKDRQVNYRGQQADFDPWVDDRGIYPDARLFDAENDFPGSRQDKVGHTYNRGVVVHALPWLSLSYNKSNNLQPNATLRDVSGDLLPDQEGEGQDYGLKFYLAGGRVVADLVYYKNYSLNRPDTAVANGVHGNFQNSINAVWTAIAAVENDTKYLDQPYAYTGSVWRDVNTGYSDGLEFSLTANVTKQWRLTVNASKRGDGETQSRGAVLKNYLATNIPLWQSNAAWINAPLEGGNGTVATEITSLESTLASFDALADLPSDSLLSPQWSGNLISAYDFSKDSALKGFSVGATANARGQTVIGFAEDSSGTLVADKPYYADEFITAGAWVTYRRRILDGKVGWRLQLNVRNVFDSNKVFPSRAVDRRDGSGEPDIAIVRLNQPRTFLLTSSFAF